MFDYILDGKYHRSEWTPKPGLSMGKHRSKCSMFVKSDTCMPLASSTWNHLPTHFSHPLDPTIKNGGFPIYQIVNRYRRVLRTLYHFYECSHVFTVVITFNDTSKCVYWRIKVWNQRKTPEYGGKMGVQIQIITIFFSGIGLPHVLLCYLTILIRYTCIYIYI